MTRSTVYLVDDDASVIESLSMLLRTHGHHVRAFCCPRQFVETTLTDRPACAVIDLKMPGLNGIEVQKALRDKGVTIPLIFISGHGDLESAVTAMREGAADFLAKPFKTSDLLFRIDSCLRSDAEALAKVSAQDDLVKRYHRLSPREHEVFDLLVAGMTVKRIGLQLSISPRTAEKHRHNVLKKMAVDSVVELVHAAVALDRAPEVTS